MTCFTGCSSRRHYGESAMQQDTPSADRPPGMPGAPAQEPPAWPVIVAIDVIGTILLARLLLTGWAVNLLIKRVRWQQRSP